MKSYKISLALVAVTALFMLNNLSANAQLKFTISGILTNLEKGDSLYFKPILVPELTTDKKGKPFSTQINLDGRFYYEGSHRQSQCYRIEYKRFGSDAVETLSPLILITQGDYKLSYNTESDVCKITGSIYDDEYYQTYASALAAMGDFEGYDHSIFWDKLWELDGSWYAFTDNSASTELYLVCLLQRMERMDTGSINAVQSRISADVLKTPYGVVFNYIRRNLKVARRETIDFIYNMQDTSLFSVSMLIMLENSLISNEGEKVYYAYLKTTSQNNVHYASRGSSKEEDAISNMRKSRNKTGRGLSLKEKEKLDSLCNLMFEKCYKERKIERINKKDWRDTYANTAYDGISDFDKQIVKTAVALHEKPINAEYRIEQVAKYPIINGAVPKRGSRAADTLPVCALTAVNILIDAAANANIDENSSKNFHNAFDGYGLGARRSSYDLAVKLGWKESTKPQAGSVFFRDSYISPGNDHTGIVVYVNEKEGYYITIESDWLGEQISMFKYPYNENATNTYDFCRHTELVKGGYQQDGKKAPAYTFGTKMRFLHSPNGTWGKLVSNRDYPCGK
ncbi:MAG: CHAP domain-containing protein [Ignavibacteria bacterium]|jgi:hypothetical protein|nr:CHAP domain-containing protein [Ignavibacteria bacterium]